MDRQRRLFRAKGVWGKDTKLLHLLDYYCWTAEDLCSRIQL